MPENIRSDGCVRMELLPIHTRQDIRQQLSPAPHFFISNTAPKALGIVWQAIP